MKRNAIRETEIHLCRECRHAVPVQRFHTLSIKGEPTLAECPFSHARCRLLSERACQTHFKPR